MKEREIVSQNKDYFAYYPKRAGWLSQVTPCRKGAYWDIEYKKECLMMFEMAFNRNVGEYVSTDRLVIITDDGIQDTGDIIFYLKELNNG